MCLRADSVMFHRQIRTRRSPHTRTCRCPSDLRVALVSVDDTPAATPTITDISRPAGTATPGVHADCHVIPSRSAGRTWKKWTPMNTSAIQVIPTTAFEEKKNSGKTQWPAAMHGGNPWKDSHRYYYCYNVHSVIL